MNRFLKGIIILFIILTSASFADKISSLTAAGDSLTIIQRPIVNVPFLGLPGDSISVEFSLAAPNEISAVKLAKNGQIRSMNFMLMQGLNGHGMKLLTIYETANMPSGLFDLILVCDNPALNDTSRNAVCFLPEWRDEFYFVQVTDTHMPSHLFWGDEGVELDLTEINDFREVIRDINIISPEFVLHTGDFINDGELEALGIPAISISKQLLYELQVPCFMVPGNHDLGGWDATPAPDGTARRLWWKYFGWSYLNTTDAAKMKTQNYSFDYGNCHFTGLESYVNYDGWREEIYGYMGFIPEQMEWLDNELVQNSDADLNVLFYHLDFDDVMNVATTEADAAFYGHVHRNRGDVNAYPLNLSTNNTCDGERSYRIIKVADGEITETNVLSAGTNGNLISKQSTIDGTTVILSNQSDMDFEHCRAELSMICDTSRMMVENGRIVSADTLQEVVTVEIFLPANGSVRVSVSEDTTLTKIKTDIPEDFNLNIYPNPFNPIVSAEYTLPEPMRVRLSLCDMTGRDLDILQTGRLEAGKHKMMWDGSLYPSGIYILNLYAESQRAVYHKSRKAVLIK